MSGKLAKGAAAAAPKLEYLGNNRTKAVSVVDPSNPVVGWSGEPPCGSACQSKPVVGGQGPRLVVKPCHCKCRTCPGCGPKLAWLVRAALIAIARKIFKKPCMLTLTVDRREFGSSQAAHRFISDKGCIRLLMRHLKIKHYAWVLEFQQKTGDGWPHWHILIDLSDCPGGRVDLEAAWKFWRRKWNLGGMKLSERHQFEDPVHAVNYVTKYLSKLPASGYPDWVLNSKKRIRFFQGSRSLGPLTGYCSTSSKSEPSEKRKRRRSMVPLIDRMAACEQRSHVLVETVEPGVPEPSYRYVGKLPVAPGRLVLLRTLGKINAGLGIEPVETVRFGNIFTEARPFIALKGIEDARAAFVGLETALDSTTELSQAYERIEARRKEILKRASLYGQPAHEVSRE